MNGPIAQLVALTCHGNAYIQGRSSGQIFPNNSTFKFCHRIEFVSLQRILMGQTKEKVVSQTPDDWFKYLKNNGAKKIRLNRVPQNDPKFSDRMTAGLVGGGGTWSIEVQYLNDKCETWIARWEVWNDKAPENKIWRVVYGCMSKGKTEKANPVDLVYLKKDFSQALEEIHAFSSEHDYCEGFTHCFSDALDTIKTNGKNRHGYHADLSPPKYLSLEAETLLDACQKSWVFGGMGSWNDMGFQGKDQKEYERVSNQLFEVVNKAIIAGANDQKSKAVISKNQLKKFRSLENRRK